MRGIGLLFLAGAILAVTPAGAGDAPPHLDTSGINMQPAYPASALKSGERGAIVIGVNVGNTGVINYVYPLKTSGFDDLDIAATMGVLGWHFIPAMRDGKAIAGDTAVELAFEPPAAADSASQTPGPLTDPPQPKGDFLPSSIAMDAKQGWFHNETYPVLCPNGTLWSDVEFERGHGSSQWGWSPAASLTVNAGENDEVTLRLLAGEGMQSFVFNQHEDGRDSSYSYSYISFLGQQETVSITWDATGLVTGRVGGMETHQVRLHRKPLQLELAVSSGAVKYLNSRLVCRPGNRTDS
jgi:TonB family protein